MCPLSALLLFIGFRQSLVPLLLFFGKLLGGLLFGNRLFNFDLQPGRVLAVPPRLFVDKGFYPEFNFLARLQMQRFQFQIVLEGDPLLPAVRQRLAKNGLSVFFRQHVDVP